MFSQYKEISTGQDRLSDDVSHLLKEGQIPYSSKTSLFISNSNRVNRFYLNIFYHTAVTLNLFSEIVKYIHLVTNSNIKSTKYSIINCIFKKKYKLYGLLHLTTSKNSEVGEGGSLLGGHSCRHCPRGAAIGSDDQCPRRPCRQGFVCCCCFLSQYKLLLEVARLVSLKKQITLYKWWQGRVLPSYRGWSKSLTRPGGASSLEKGTSG